MDGGMTDAERCYDLGCADPVHVAMGSHEARPMAEPQTTAGRQMHEDRHVSQDCPALTWDGKPTGEKCQWLDDILAIEREAATAFVAMKLLDTMLLNNPERPEPPRDTCIECEWTVGHDPRCETGRLTLLDVDRLARAMSGLDGVNWPKRWEPEDFEWVARQIAAHYAAAPPSKKVGAP